LEPEEVAQEAIMVIKAVAIAAKVAAVEEELAAAPVRCTGIAPGSGDAHLYPYADLQVALVVPFKLVGQLVLMHYLVAFVQRAAIAAFPKGTLVNTDVLAVRPMPPPVSRPRMFFPYVVD
jgi:hypothetical protein